MPPVQQEACFRAGRRASICVAVRPSVRPKR